MSCSRAAATRSSGAPSRSASQGALQHVLGHGDGFAEVGFGAAPLEDVGQERHDRVAVGRILCHQAASLSASDSIAANVESNPSRSA